MWDLVYKDFRLQLHHIVLSFGLAVGVGVVFIALFDGGPGIFFLLTLIMALNMTLRNAHAEDKSNTFRFLCSLPIKRSSIVASKFVSSFLYALFAYITAVMLFLISGGLGLHSFNWAIIKGVLPGYIAFLLFVGVFWILFFRFGYIKADIYGRCLFLLSIFSFVIIQRTAGWQDDFLADGVFFVMQRPHLYLLLFFIPLYFLMGRVALFIFAHRDIE